MCVVIIIINVNMDIINIAVVDVLSTHTHTREDSHLMGTEQIDKQIMVEEKKSLVELAVLFPTSARDSLVCCCLSASRISTVSKQQWSWDDKTSRLLWPGEKERDSWKANGDYLEALCAFVDQQCLT